MSEKIKLGDIPEGVVPDYRDAVHVPCICAVVGPDLKPGQHVRVVRGRAVPSIDIDDSDGVIDPFYSATLKSGHVVWVLLRPGLAQNIRHHFDLLDESISEKGAQEHDDDGCGHC